MLKPWSTYMMDQATRNDELFTTNCLKIIQEYSWLLDAFILDFYTKDLWECLPSLWREVLSKVQLEELGHWLMNSERNTVRVWPLSLIALRAAAKTYSLPREISSVSGLTMEDVSHLSVKETLDDKKVNFDRGIETECLRNPNLKNIFLKHVKQKKRHETAIMASLCAKAARKARCFYIIDVGAGKGHLSRLMAYGYGLKVCCVEAQSELILAARKLDSELEFTASKHLKASYVQNLPRPVHLQIMLNHNMGALNEFFISLRNSFGVSPEEEFCFGIVGLHPCGDLAATLLQLFAAFEEAKFICIASCCYMKLSTNKTNKLKGYPLSTHFNSLPFEFVHQTYQALEVSCHALESYCLRLQQKQYSMLRIHCYRAVLEKLIVKYWPDKRHLGLRSVKHYDTLTFVEYAKIALSHMNLEIPSTDLTSDETLDYLQRWQQVVIVYSLRLLLAPLVETAILMDRLYFLREQAVECCLVPGFDPLLSPRNLILRGWKTCNQF